MYDKISKTILYSKGYDGLTVLYHSFGCKVNQYETDCIKELMTKRGHITAYDISSADICIVNSCTVTQSADLKLGQYIRRIRRENPKALIVVCGCYVQAHSDLSLIEDADIIVGENNKMRIPELIEEYLIKKSRITSILPHEKSETIERMSLGSREGKTRAIIKIQDGCDRFCSYCIIPYARGRSRSKSIEDIKNEARQLVMSGHKEIVLVGINLSCYGRDLESADLCLAVKAAAESGAQRIRLGSIEPEMLTDDIIERLSKIDALCPHFHLSLQSGCDKTLKEMRRKYSSDEYYSLLTKLRESFEDCSITTDVMVGFPGETEEDFMQSLAFVEKAEFSKVHVFPYSERKGTPAASRDDRICSEIKNARAKIMSAVARKSEKKYLESLVGKTKDVLFEKEKDSRWHIGHTKEYVLVKVKRFTDSLWKENADVKIISAENGFCIGEILG